MPVCAEDFDTKKFDNALLQQHGMVLLLCWAPWHRRSCELREEALRILAAFDGPVLLASVNVDREASLALKLGLRALPLVILYRHGVELARTAAPSGAAGLQEWLDIHFLDIGASNLARPSVFPAGAFHGDAQRKQRLLAELREKAGAGQIVSARVPFWNGKQGSIIGALAGTIKSDQVERLSGLPFSFLCVLESLDLDWDEAIIDTIFSAIEPGADLVPLALSFARDMLGNPATGWAIFIDDAGIDALRMRWLCLMERYCAGEQIAASAWQDIVVELCLLRSPGRDAGRTVQDALIDFVSILSPPPPHDDELWSNAFSLYGIFIQLLLVQEKMGWQRDDFAFESTRLNWFVSREQQQAQGRFTETALAQARADWVALHGAAEQRHHIMLLLLEEELKNSRMQQLQRLLASLAS